MFRGVRPIGQRGNLCVDVIMEADKTGNELVAAVFFRHALRQNQGRAVGLDLIFFNWVKYLGIFFKGMYLLEVLVDLTFLIDEMRSIVY